MSLPERKESTPADNESSLFWRWNRLQVNAMEDPELQNVQTFYNSAKITSQSRLLFGAQSRIVDAENSLKMEKDQKTRDPQKDLTEKSTSNESQEKEIENERKVLRTVIGAEKGKSNPFEYFKQHRYDKDLDLNGWVLGPIRAYEIASELLPSSTVVSLFLANNRLGNEGGRAIAEGLQRNCSVRELDLSGNMLGRNSVSSIGEMLRQNRTLEKLNLSRNDLTDQDMEVFLDFLSSETVLKELDLSHNILCDQFGEHMSRVLKSNIILEKLFLSSNQLEVTGLKALMPGLRCTQSLRALNISWNYLYDVGAKILGEIIANNESLIEISACGNLFTAKAASFIAKGVVNNSNLKILRIGQNLIRNSGAYAFLDVLSQSGSSLSALEILDIDGTIVDQKFKERVDTDLSQWPGALKVVKASVVDEISNELEQFVEKSPEDLSF
ncbi:leucine-rich repeat-containing protein 74A-like [Stylophora pistillata]|uniref:leucine-rich repeat-containing protein 74A-like n=1 Tax=Stylophora pistillata TaxID=50429 RepID=UPI000C0494DA|nr:leucine-rich repeat-containing protein 74A-like [Stylophora pistillata]